MIVSAWRGHYRMTTNDEHARLAGRLARALRAELLPAGGRTEEFAFAAAEHDRGWIGLDEVPVWNDSSDRPFSVTDYPLGLRLPFYKQGVAEVEAQSAYAALLCSMHYTNLPPEFMTHIVGGPAAGLSAAIATEKARQNRIRSSLGLSSAADEAMIARHLALLQLADTLSLYLCTAVGADQGDMSAPFAQLFRRAAAAVVGGEIALSRTSGDVVSLSPALFGGPLEASYRTRDVPVALIEEKGIAAAYAHTASAETHCTIG
ncbi:DUF3891 family protein [Cohnella sp. 56]|uniref:DUF3891 family protein n=1 Tax=Cohnella sp. 56 TaxID=3113722 RepID=UPI0030E9A752